MYSRHVVYSSELINVYAHILANYLSRAFVIKVNDGIKRFTKVGFIPSVKLLKLGNAFYAKFEEFCNNVAVVPVHQKP